MKKYPPVHMEKMIMEDTEWICSAITDCFFPLFRPYQASGSSAESFDKYPVLVTCRIQQAWRYVSYCGSMTCLLYASGLRGFNFEILF
jgi:hypothetical protein